MEVREELEILIEEARKKAITDGALPEGDYAPVQRPEIPKMKNFGDYSTNAAMQWAKTAHLSPRAIAEILVKYITSPMISSVNIAGAGFINFFYRKILSIVSYNRF